MVVSRLINVVVVLPQVTKHGRKHVSRSLPWKTLRKKKNDTVRFERRRDLSATRATRPPNDRFFYVNHKKSSVEALKSILANNSVRFVRSLLSRWNRTCHIVQRVRGVRILNFHWETHWNMFARYICIRIRCNIYIHIYRTSAKPQNSGHGCRILLKPRWTLWENSWAYTRSRLDPNWTLYTLGRVSRSNVSFHRRHALRCSIEASIARR